MCDGSPLLIAIAEEAHDQIVHSYRGGDQIVRRIGASRHF
jgi:hypothetical protein